jgi:hypothetical protein
MIQLPEPAPIPPTPEPRWLFERGPSAFRYIVRMWLLSLIPSIALATVSLGLFSAFGLPTDKAAPQLSDFGGISNRQAFVFVVLIAPMYETLLLSIGIALISLITARPVVIAAISAVGWGILHFLDFHIQGIVVMWPFFVMSCAYLAWRPIGWFRACGVAMSIHMLQNLLPGLLILFV